MRIIKYSLLSFFAYGCTLKKAGEIPPLRLNYVSIGKSAASSFGNASVSTRTGKGSKRRAAQATASVSTCVQTVDLFTIYLLKKLYIIQRRL